MPFVVTDLCAAAKDGACIDVCPVDCIRPTRSSSEFAAASQVYINPDECICCGLCVLECPVQAIFSAEDLPPAKVQYVQINRDWFAKKDA